jgi:UDP-N-acetylglucosamine--N-acetylmuramyl-(pentapeptide) pyrophosphoryl-undecaprenol N-acetylglucosamine transferase
MIGAERGLEARLLPEREFRFHLLPVEPLYRREWWKNLRWPLVAGRVLAGIRRVFHSEQPAAVIGTGGYASGPAVWWAQRLGVPTALQEQNAFPGLVTSYLAGRATHLYLGVPEARQRLEPGRNTQVFDTGNPITPPDRGRVASARRRFGLPAPEADSRPILLITGGSQGAVALNEAVAAWLEAGGGRGAIVLWATGVGSYARFARLHSPPAVQVFDFLDPIADAYAVADLSLGRAGMMTGAELCAWGVPSILVPLPTAAGDHQRYNALALQAAGAARVLLQGELTPQRLDHEIGPLLRDRPRLAAMARAAAERGRPAAAAEIAAHLEALLDLERVSQL